MDGISLPPDLEQFAAEVVASGAYRDMTDVVTAAVRLLRQQRTERDAFIRSLEDAEAEANRDGWLSLDEVLADADAVIADHRKAE